MVRMRSICLVPECTDSCPGSQRFAHFLKHCSPLATRPAFAENCCAIFSNTSFFVAFPTPNKCLLSSHVEIKRRTSASPHRSRLFPGCTGSCKYSVSADEVDKQEGSKATAEKSCMQRICIEILNEQSFSSVQNADCMAMVQLTAAVHVQSTKLTNISHENKRGQRGKLRVLAVICHSH